MVLEHWVSHVNNNLKITVVIFAQNKFITVWLTVFNADIEKQTISCIGAMYFDNYVNNRER